jgi:MraZ protein
VFTGEYLHTVDEKGRLAVPVRFRAAFDQGGRVTKWIDGCLALFTNQDWEALSERTAPLSVTDKDARIFVRFLYGSAFEIKLDGQGRFVLPATLRAFAEIENEAAVIGARNHLELWQPATWRSYSQLMDQPEVLAEHLQGLGI